MAVESAARHITRNIIGGVAVAAALGAATNLKLLWDLEKEVEFMEQRISTIESQGEIITNLRLEVRDLATKSSGLSASVEALAIKTDPLSEQLRVLNGLLDRRERRER